MDEAVCTDKTGYVEVVQVTFDPSIVSYEQLLEVFWGNHNPTTFNRQGPDIGSQYRSVIFYHTPEQKFVAEESRDALTKSGRWKNPTCRLAQSARGGQAGFELCPVTTTSMFLLSDVVNINATQVTTDRLIAELYGQKQFFV
ncbi:MAG: Peptide methionine sulfoxide reductase MsrA [Candidatus Uhrbacteria bacterium GW2011_GWA2_53_10]|uniref:peptide-methionine (S)-S-oxide reductase n=1 Tax=Candidatus Uhrbacteria bacterium GW2011_GWA2_53_10 TaxID=1618980 RepID=A0A0G1XN98_9BACT|nr:MAG: Peptide methionine sulfoxide reductase MsrA [Candidatus Uhrbacteria bacterium GW2011_GWA2_53_10]